MTLLNEEIAGEEFAIGPSYFMTDSVNGPDLERVWDRAIMPLLDEHHYGLTWDREACSLVSLRKKLAAADGPIADDPDESSELRESSEPSA